VNHASDAAARRDFRLRYVARCFWLAAALAGAMAMARADNTGWIKLTAPQFTVISEVSESRTRAWATEFELFHRGIASVLRVPPERLEPLRVVLFSSDRSFRPYKPRSNGKPAEMSGFFLREPGRNIVAVAVEGMRQETRENIFHEATHWHLAAFERDLPLWLNEGLAELFGNFELQGDKFKLGQIRPEFVKYVRAFEPLPYSHLAEVGAGGLQYDWHHVEQTSKFYAEAWTAAHMFALGTPNGLGRLRQYLSAPPDGSSRDRELLGYFDLTPQQFDRRLADYLGRRRIDTLVVPLDRRNVGENFVMQAADAADVDLVLGELLLGMHRMADAKPLLTHVLAAQPNNVAAQEALGEVAAGEGRNREAIEYFQHAQALGSESFRVRFFAALAGWSDRRRDGVIGPEALDRATWNLVNVLTDNPRLAAGYELAGLMMADAENPVIRARLDPLVQAGERRYPSAAGVLIGRAYAALWAGDFTQARRRAAGASAAPSELPELVQHAQARLLDTIALAEIRLRHK